MNCANHNRLGIAGTQFDTGRRRDVTFRARRRILELAMPFLVQGRLGDVTLTATTETSKQAFAKAIEWKVAERFADVTISHGSNTYSTDEFASVMARLEIQTTVGRNKDDPDDK